MALQDHWTHIILSGSGVVVSMALFVAMVSVVVYKLSCCSGRTKAAQDQEDYMYEDMECGNKKLETTVHSVEPSRYHDTSVVHKTPQEYEVPLPVKTATPDLPRRAYLQDREFVRSLHECELPQLPTRGYLVEDEFLRELSAYGSNKVSQSMNEPVTVELTGCSELEPEDKVYQPLIPPRLEDDQMSPYQTLTHDTMEEGNDTTQLDYEPVMY